MTTEERLAALEATVGALDRAVEKSESTLKDRLAGMNEIREAMRDQSAKYITRSELLAACLAVVTIMTAIAAVMNWIMRH